MRRPALIVAALLAALPAAARADYQSTVRSTAGLVSYWPLDEAAGPTITDVIGNRGATLGPTAGFGRPPGIDAGGTSVSLAGTTYASFGNVDTFTGDFTVEAWVTQTSTTSDQVVVSKGNGSGGYIVSMLAGGRPALQVNGNRIVAPAVSAGGWHQVVGTLAGRTMTVYVDGRSVATGPASNTVAATTQSLTIGRYSRLAAYYFQGGLDEISLYNRALDAATVAAHFNAGADTSAPHTVLTDVPPAASDTPDGTFAFTGSKGGVTFRCSLDGGAAVSCPGTYSYDLLRDGSHTLAITATDRWGTVESPATTYTWDVTLPPGETAAPVTTLAGAPAAVATTTAAQFSFTGSKSGVHWSCRLDAGAWTSCSSPVSYANLAEGPHAFDARATDRWGTVEAVPAHYAWTVDLHPPQVTLATTPPASTDQPDGTFTFAATGTGVVARCSIDGAAATTCSQSYRVDLLRSGTHTLTITATDRYGVAAAPATYQWTVALPANEAAPPVTTITSAPPALSTAAAAQFALSGSKTKLTWACRLDGGAWAPCGASVSLANLRDGTHTFEARATDRWGAVESPVSYTWKIDRTPPETFVLSSKATAAAPGIALLGSEAGAAFQCRLGDADWSPCSASMTLPTVTAPTPLAVRAVDAAGNVDPSPATIEIDAPDAVTPVLFSGASKSFLVGGNRTIAGLQCSLDGAPASSCPWPLDFTGLGYGPHSLQITDPKLGGVVFPTFAWNSALPTPLLAGSQFPALLSLGSRGAQAHIAKARLPRLLFQSNAAGTATVRLQRGRRTIASWTARVIQGSNLVTLPRAAYLRLRPGRYALRVTVANASGTSLPLLLRFDAARLSR